MVRRLSIGRFLLSIGILCIGALSAGGLKTVAQEPPNLEIFTSPDGAFQFIYPENYQLLVGERILKASQGRHVAIPVCDFATALVCVIYPVEGTDNSRFEAAGFSVDTVRGSNAESECLAYSDRFSRDHGDQFPSSSISINGFVFRYAAIRKIIAGHLQSLYLYRTFQKEHCYELRIAVSLADESGAQQPGERQPSSSKSAADREAENARGSLQLILSSFAFK